MSVSENLKNNPGYPIEPSTGIIDEPMDIREGEELDTVRLREYLRSSLPALGQEELTVKQFPSGWSNLTYLLKIGKQEYILRRPPLGRKAKTAHDMSREYRVLKALKPRFRYCPEAILYCEDESVIGSPFFLMERLHGIIPRRELPEGLELSATQCRALSENFVRIFAELHSIDCQEVGLGDFGKPEGYVRRQVEGWSQRYREARTPDAPSCEEVMQWLHDKMPGECGRVSVIHNDYKFNNAVLNPENPSEITGILDWEMATIGDPLMDLGSALAYWVENTDTDFFQATRAVITHLEGMQSRKEVVELYSKCTGLDVSALDFYFCFGIFRLAVIGQQIYYRAYHKQTKDDRFAVIIYGVHIFEQTARQVIERSSL
jgi:aminoglycoside phosphotransferase (APT) family kinase protein